MSTCSITGLVCGYPGDAVGGGCASWAEDCPHQLFPANGRLPFVDHHTCRWCGKVVDEGQAYCSLLCLHYHDV